MKGIVFTTFNKMVELELGLSSWDKLIQETKPLSGGVYTAGDNYDEKELFVFVDKISDWTKIKKEDLLFSFGEFLLLQLTNRYQKFFEGKNFISFLLSVDSIIHYEVKKIFPDASFPKIDYEIKSENHIVLIYQSKRKLCYLAEGLISGAAIYFKESYELVHSDCMLKGDKCCRLEIKCGGQNE